MFTYLQKLGTLIDESQLRGWEGVRLANKMKVTQVFVAVLELRISNAN